MMAGAMEEPRACVVEVTKIVPAEDVPYVAARVAERLGMPLDRVRKLIESRTGPITRPLRPDKADAIAQTFEAAGVSVVIRPATEDDEIGAVAPPATTATDSVTDSATGDAPQEAPEPVSGSHAVDEAEPTAERDPEVDPEPEPEMDPEPEPESEPEPEPVLERYEAFDADDDLAAPAPDDRHGIVMEVDEGEREVPSAADHAAAAALDHAQHVAEMQRAAAVALEPDDDLDETNDPGPFGLEARGEVRVRVEHDPAFAEDATEMPGMADRAAVDTRDGAPRATAGGPAVLADQQMAEPTGGRSTSTGGETSPFGDPDTWGGEDPSGGWIIGSRKARRFEVLHDDEPVSELTDGAGHDSHAGGDEPDAHGDAGMPDQSDADPEERLPWRGAPGIGRESRRPRVGALAGPGGIGRVEFDDPTGREPGDADDAFDATDAPHAPDPPGATDALDARDGDADDDVRASDDPSGGTVREVRGAPTVVPPAAARTVPAPVRAPGVVPVPQPSARTPAGVPTAWRGLGGEDHGPARPVDAQLPRRFGEDFDERVRRVSAARVARRRTAMLISLAIALGLFVLAQVWVAGRAAPAFDAGLHRFRDADFGAAQRVWTQLAGAGDANAQFMLGYLSEAGLGRPWSARAAAAWYRLAADAGHAEAQWRLGGLYEMGLGVPHEPAAALRWWGAAAAGGHGEAAFRLGRARLEGVAGPSDAAGALAAFERALDLGWPAARPYRDALLIASSGRPHPDALP